MDYRSSEFSNSVNSCISAVKGQQEFLCSNNCGMYYVNLLFFQYFPLCSPFLALEIAENPARAEETEVTTENCANAGVHFM